MTGNESTGCQGGRRWPFSFLPVFFFRSLKMGLGRPLFRLVRQSGSQKKSKASSAERGVREHVPCAFRSWGEGTYRLSRVSPTRGRRYSQTGTYPGPDAAFHFFEVVIEKRPGNAKNWLRHRKLGLHVVSRVLFGCSV